MCSRFARLNGLGVATDATGSASLPAGFGIQEAAETVGFFYLDGHGVSPSIVEAARAEARAFLVLRYRG